MLIHTPFHLITSRDETYISLSRKRNVKSGVCFMFAIIDDRLENIMETSFLLRNNYVMAPAHDGA